MKRWFVLFVLGCFAAAVVWAQTNARPASASPTVAAGSSVMKGFMVPEYDPTTGLLKWKLFGETARVQLLSGKVEVQTMKIEVYRDTNVNMIVTSPVCLFDRTSKTATSEDTVEIVSTNMVVNGRGFEWYSADSRLNIHNDVTVRIMNRKKNAFPAPEPESK